MVVGPASLARPAPAAGRSFTLRDLLEREGVWSWLMLTPGVLFLLAFVAYPFFYGIFLSLQEREEDAVEERIGDEGEQEEDAGRQHQPAPDALALEEVAQRERTTGGGSRARERRRADRHRLRRSREVHRVPVRYGSACSLSNGGAPMLCCSAS